MKDQDKATKKKESVNEDEIDLIALVKTLWEGRRVIIRAVLIFAILGLFVAMFSKKEYTATTTMVPQVNSASSKMGGLSSLASLAGFNLDMSAGGNELSPILYPKIVSSTEFQLEVINAKYSFEELDEEVTLFDYYKDYYKTGFFGVIRKYTIGLPGLIIGVIKGDEKIVALPDQANSKIIRISKDQYEIIKDVKEKLTLSVNDKDGYLTLESRFHEASLSAQVAELAKELLQENVTQLKIEKARGQMEFVEERYEEKRTEFKEAQAKLAAFRDANKNISSALMRTKEESLQNENQLAFEVYSELAKQLEQARIKVKEDTPVFSVIEEVVMPVKKSKPNRAMLLIVWVFLGGILGIGWVFGKYFFEDIHKRLSESETED
jgi:uncharacterized protein involved in exopolysaccharide biosynthesis